MIIFILLYHNTGLSRSGQSGTSAQMANTHFDEFLVFVII